jgi:hypothetical protein
MRALPHFDFDLEISALLHERVSGGVALAHLLQIAPIESSSPSSRKVLAEVISSLQSPRGS